MYDSDSDSKPVNEEGDHPWKEAINKGYGTTGLSKMRLRALPKAFIQPPEKRSSSMIRASSQASGDTIPIIDMSKAEAAELICEAAEKWGFFQVINHGVPAVLMSDVMHAARRFLGQAAEEKRRFLKENTSCSNVVYMTSFFAEAEKGLEWSDYLSMNFVSEEEAYAFWPAISK